VYSSFSPTKSHLRVVFVSLSHPLTHLHTLFLSFSVLALAQDSNKALFGSFYGNSNNAGNALHSNGNLNEKHSNDGINSRVAGSKIETTTEKFTWGFQTVPTLYSVYQKVTL